MSEKLEKMAKVVSTHHYNINTFPYSLLKTIIVGEINLLIRRTKRVSTNNFFHETLYYGSKLNKTIAMPVKTLGKEELCIEDLKLIKKAFDKHDRRNDVNKVVIKYANWSFFCTHAEALLGGLSDPRLQEKYDFVGPLFIKEVEHHFSDIINKYEIYQKQAKELLGI